MDRRLTAILAADVVGYSRLMGEDEVGTLEGLKSCRRELIDPEIKKHHGRVLGQTRFSQLAALSSPITIIIWVFT